MAFSFGKKPDKADPQESPQAPNGDGLPQGGFSPEKAQKFFVHAQAAHDSLNYPYAIQLWLNGFTQDPSSMLGFEGFLNSIGVALAEGKKLNRGEIEKGLQGKGLIRKYQLALLEWGFKRDDPKLTLKAAEAAGELGLKEQTSILGRIAFASVRADPKRQKKENYVAIVDAFVKAGVYDLAVEAGSEAVRLAPEDADLARRIQQLAAQSTISSGGYDDTGKEGGFRRNVRDIQKQTDLEASDSISKSDDVKDRLIAAAEAELEKRPEDIPTIEKTIRALRDRGRKEDLARALALCDRAHKLTGAFRFLEVKGDIKVGRMREQIIRARRKLEQEPDNLPLREQIAQAESKLTAVEIEELTLQVEAYPTDLRRKFALAERFQRQARHDEAIPLLQQALDDPKIRGRVQKALADSFIAIGGWEDNAIELYDAALASVIDDAGSLALELRYSLMLALIQKAEKDRDTEAAHRADRLAGEIAMKQFNYRDVKDLRKRIKDWLEAKRA